MKKNVLALLFGIGMVVFLITIVEIILYHLNEENLILRDDTPVNSLYMKDETLGYKPRYNTVIRDHMYLKNGLELYDVEYSIDMIGRRITPRDCSDSIARQDVLFFGGSYTFGAGVNDNETLPYYVSEFAPEYRVFNYGFCGYGPQQMLELLMRDDIASGVAGEDPILIYPFIDCHLLRLVGSMRRHAIWTEDFPYYFLNAEGDLERRGSFKTGRPLISLIYKLFGKSQILRILRVDIPLRMTEKHLDLFCAVIEESKILYEKKFGGHKFIVIFYPQYGKLSDRIKPRFEKMGIDYIDYSELRYGDLRNEYCEEHPGFSKENIRIHIPVDNHPTGDNYRLVAARLVKDLHEYKFNEE